jgi:glucose/arabinose dehydrogenase
MGYSSANFRAQWVWQATVAAIAAAGGAPACHAVVSAEFLLDMSGGAFNGSAFTQIERAPGRPNELFASRQDGRIVRVDLTTNTQSTFFTLPTADISVGQYWGLLGFTFAPDFETSGNLYVHVADDRNVDDHHHRIYIRRYTLDDPMSNSPTLEETTNIMRWGQHGTDHSGGWIGFQPGDPDTLWITSGDGGNVEGSGRDMLRTGQDPTDLLASVLRVNVSGSGAGEFGNYSIPANNPFADGADGAPEVWSFGLRSPWGGSFDRATGDFWLGDVGASRIGGNTGQEEVNFERSDSTGARNYGWRVMEGTTCPTTQDPNDPPCGDPSFTPPIYDYEYGGGYGNGGADPFEGRSVTGGYVYRGPVNELQGKYIFGDWASHQVWAFEIDRDANGGLGEVIPSSLIDLSDAFDRPTDGGTSQTAGVTAFGEDAAGNLYFTELNGRLFKITGTIIPEPIAGDFDGDDDVDADDLVVWQNAFAAGGNASGDADGDGDTDGADFLVWQQNIGAASTATGGAVPEPSTPVLLGLAALVLLTWRKAH